MKASMTHPPSFELPWTTRRTDTAQLSHPPFHTPVPRAGSVRGHLPCGLMCSGGTITEGGAAAADGGATGSGSRLETVTLAGADGWNGRSGGG